MIKQSEILQKRLDRNYRDYLAQLRGRTADELIALAPEITAAQQLREELVQACTEESMAYLLQFDNPLEEMRGYWEAEITGYDHSGEIGHMLWEIRDRDLVPGGDHPVKEQDHPPVPTMEAPC